MQLRHSSRYRPRNILPADVLSLTNSFCLFCVSQLYKKFNTKFIMYHFNRLTSSCVLLWAPGSVIQWPLFHMRDFFALTDDSKCTIKTHLVLCPWMVWHSPTCPVSYIPITHFTHSATLMPIFFLFLPPDFAPRVTEPSLCGWSHYLKRFLLGIAPEHICCLLLRHNWKHTCSD